ncbi:MAG: hypothetical protein PVG92_05835 [Holophagae bacterium]|jgi:hypothetical protein
MKMALLAAIVVVAVVVVALVSRGLVRRLRLLRRLDRAEGAVAEAMADGRLATPTGEALLQHLDGLRRACVWGGEG